MWGEALIITVAALGIGILIGYPLFRKFKFIEKAQDKSIQKIVNDPEALKAKLEKSGEIVDLGEKVEFFIKTDESGKKVLDFKKQKVELPKSLKAKESPQEKKKKKKKKAKKEEFFVNPEELDLNAALPDEYFEDETLKEQADPEMPETNETGQTQEKLSGEKEDDDN